eukprot:SAG11_NODE_5359_length_1582_cov_8.929872_2_plen_91_part_00
MEAYQRDPFTIIGESGVERLRKAFRNEVEEAVKKPKICISAEIFSAMMDTLSATDRSERVDRNLYTVFMISGTRVASLVLILDLCMHSIL